MCLGAKVTSEAVKCDYVCTILIDSGPTAGLCSNVVGCSDDTSSGTERSSIDNV